MRYALRWRWFRLGGLSPSLHLEENDNQREGGGSFSSRPSEIKKCRIPNTGSFSGGRYPRRRSSFPGVAGWQEPHLLISHHELSLLSISTHPHPAAWLLLPWFSASEMEGSINTVSTPRCFERRPVRPLKSIKNSSEIENTLLTDQISERPQKFFIPSGTSFVLNNF